MENRSIHLIRHRAHRLDAARERRELRELRSWQQVALTQLLAQDREIDGLRAENDRLRAQLRREEQEQACLLAALLAREDAA